MRVRVTPKHILDSLDKEFNVAYLEDCFIFSYSINSGLIMVNMKKPNEKAVSCSSYDATTGMFSR